MAFDAGAVVGRVNLETGEFTANIVGAINNTDKMTKSMLGAQIQFALLEKAIGAVTGLLKDSLGSWSAQEAAMAQTEARIKSTGGAAGYTSEELFKMSEAIQAQTTYADEDALAMENLLLTFTNIRGPVFKEATQAILDMSTALGQDLGSSAQIVGRALQDPIRGMAQLRRSGITFTEAQKAMVQELMRAGKLQEAQGIILGELEKKFGGAAAAAKDTFGGALKSLNNDLDDTKEAIGQALAPIIQDLIGAVRPAIEWIKKIDQNTVRLAVTFGGLIAATFAIGKAVQALGNMMKAGISPLQGVLMAIAAVGAVVTVVNEVMARARTIHQELADAYMQEYVAIDGQVSRYEELKNKTKLSSKEKAELVKVESSLKTQLGETSAFIQDQSGKWIVNANSVNKYKKERLDLAVRELKAQIVVSTNEAKFAREREAYFKVYEGLTKKLQKQGALTTEENLARTGLALKYGFDLINLDKARLFTMQETQKTSETLSTAQGQLNALTTEGVTAAIEYKNGTDQKTKSQLTNTEVTDEQRNAQADLNKMLRDGSRDLLDEKAKELAALDDELALMNDLAQSQYDLERIQEYGAKKRAAIENKYADAAAKEWQDFVGKIEKEMNKVLDPIGKAWSAIEGVWAQALQNEETALENEYQKKKDLIEANVLDETERAAQLAALDEEYDKKKRELQKKQWALDKASKISGAVMGTAQAVVAALAVFPPWVGIALAALVGALGAVQIGLIAAEPMPAFASGGMAEAGTTALVGEEGPEVVTFGKTARVFPADESARMLNGGGNFRVTQPLVLTFDGKPFFRGLLQATRDRIALVDGGAVV